MPRIRSLPAAAALVASVATVAALLVSPGAGAALPMAPAPAVSVPDATPEVLAATARRPTLSASWSADVAKAGARVTVSGRLRTPAAGRKVVLQVRAGTRWVARARVLTRSGSYRVAVPTSTYGVFTYRLVSPVSAAQRSAGQRPAVSATKSFRVARTSAAPKTAPAPLLGSASDFTRIVETRARWNPCSPISFRVNTTNGPDHALRDTLGAVERIEQATGLDLEYVGPTKVVPQTTRAEGYPADTQIVIAWASAAQSPLISGERVAGVGGPLGWGGTVDEDGRDILTWRRGTVVLNSGYNWLPKGFGTGTTSGKLLMHELGHVVGLGHAAGDQQVMYPTLQRESPSAWQAGDTAGLRSQGAQQGCIYNRDGSTPTNARAAGVGVVSQVTVDGDLHAVEDH